MAVRTEPYVLVASPRRASVLTWGLVWLSGPLLALMVLLLLWNGYIAQRFLPGVRVGDVSLDGLTWEQAEQALQRAYKQVAAPPVEVRWGSQIWFLFPEAVGQQPDLRDALMAAYAVGREESWQARWRSQLRLVRQGLTMDVPWRQDPGKTRWWFNRLVIQVYVPLREPSVSFDGREVVYTPGQPGREVDITTTWPRLQQALSEVTDLGLPPKPLTVAVREVSPAVVDVRTLEESVRHLATQPIILRAGEQTLALDPFQLSPAVTLVPSNAGENPEVRVDRDHLREILTQLAATYRRPPVDARLDYDPINDRFIVISPSQNGWELDVDAAVEAVASALESGQREVQVPVRVLRPQVPMDATPAALGIREVIGEGVTYFRGSSAPRVANIVRSAEAVRGVVIPPGGVFSFNEAAGAITAANGYEDSLIIWGDRTAVGIGGGVCQVSTTLFRAAFYAGLPIVERWNHGYIVSWYGEPGLDATVYSPYVDFKFKNTTNAYVLVQPIVDVEEGVLIFRLWGTDPGWEVEVSEAIKENIQEPPPPVYQEDPSLPTGVVRQVEWAKPGMTVRITRTVRRGDTIIEQREFVSTYQPWRAVYLYGPGTRVPGGTEGG